MGGATYALSGSSGAAVSAVEGNGYGYQLVVGLFGGPPNTRGFGQTEPPGTAASDSPSVQLAPDGSNSPQTDTEPSVVAQVGPATFLTTGAQTVTSTGTTGPSGSVSTTATIDAITNVNGGALTASQLAGSCTSSETGALSGTTTIATGRLETDSGDDINGDGDFVDAGEHAPVVVDLPANPAPNTDIAGHIHVNGVQEDFVYRFNEQVTEASGALTVVAAHQFIGVVSLDPRVEDADAIARGDLRIGKVTCGLTGAPDPTTTTAPTTSTTMGTTTSTMGTTTSTMGTTTSTMGTTTSTMGTTTSTMGTTTSTMGTTTSTMGTTTSTMGSTSTSMGSTSTSMGSTSTSMGSTSTTMVPPTERDCRGVAATIIGTEGDDDIEGTPGDDVILGSAGNDRIRGLGGDDLICGGAGDDRLVGGSGADRIIGGDGNDTISGDAGADELAGSDGDDTIRGGEGDDKLDGRNGTDGCRAGAGTDIVVNCEI